MKHVNLILLFCWQLVKVIFFSSIIAGILNLHGVSAYINVMIVGILIFYLEDRKDRRKEKGNE